MATSERLLRCLSRNEPQLVGGRVLELGRLTDAKWLKFNAGRGGVQ